MNAMNRDLKSRIQLQKNTRRTENTVPIQPVPIAIRTIEVEVSAFSIARVVVATRGVNTDELKLHVQDLLQLNRSFQEGEKIMLSQVSDCDFNLTFSKQTINENNVLESHFYTM